MDQGIGGSSARSSTGRPSMNPRPCCIAVMLQGLGFRVTVSRWWCQRPCCDRWIRAQGSGFRVQGSGFRVQSSGFRVQGAGCRVQGSGFRVPGSGFCVLCSGCRVQGSGFRVQGRVLSSRVYGLGLRFKGSGFGVKCRVFSSTRWVPQGCGVRRNLRWTTRALLHMKLSCRQMRTAAGSCSAHQTRQACTPHSSSHPLCGKTRGLPRVWDGRLGAERLVFHCWATSATTATCTSRKMCCLPHCACYHALCQPMLRAFFRWIRSPPPTDVGSCNALHVTGVSRSLPTASP